MSRPWIIDNLAFTQVSLDESYHDRRPGRVRFTVYQPGGILQLSCVRCHTAFDVSIQRDLVDRIQCPFCHRTLRDEGVR